MNEEHFDVCVVGGGPAGSAAAKRLANLGHSVCLVERAVFPRPHVGESLTPGIRPVFDVLRLGEPEGNGFSASGESLIRWSGERVERLALSQRAGGLLVDRGRFDVVLMNAAKVDGVRTFQPARMTNVERNGLDWRLEVAEGNRSTRISAKFLVDAAGRKGFLPGKRRSISPRTVALCGYVSSETCPKATLVEATPDGWCWGAPIPGGLFSSMVFIDSGTVRTERSKGLEFIWRSRLAKTELFSAFCALRLIARPIACDATTYFAEDPMDGNLIRVGEACFALDPLSSMGVEKSMQSGLVAATALHTLLTRPAREALCTNFYRDRQREIVSAHASWSSEFYGEVRRYRDLPFWRKRTDGQENTLVEEGLTPVPAGPMPTLECKLKISAKTELIEQGCIVGDEICSRPLLVHPGLRRPVAFIGGVEVEILLDLVRRSTDLRRLLQLWSNRMPRSQAIDIAAWLLRKEILETVP